MPRLLTRLSRQAHKTQCSVAFRTRSHFLSTRWRWDTSLLGKIPTCLPTTSCTRFGLHSIASRKQPQRCTFRNHQRCTAILSPCDEIWPMKYDIYLRILDEIVQEAP